MSGHTPWSKIKHKSAQLRIPGVELAHLAPAKSVCELTGCVFKVGETHCIRCGRARASA